MHLSVGLVLRTCLGSPRY